MPRQIVQLPTSNTQTKVVASWVSVADSKISGSVEAEITLSDIALFDVGGYCWENPDTMRFKVKANAEIPISQFSMTFSPARNPYAMVILDTNLSNLMTTSLLTHWDLRIEEIVSSAYLTNFKALGPTQKAKETPLGVGSIGKASGSFKKAPDLVAGDASESYEFTITLQNNLHGNSVLQI